MNFFARFAVGSASFICALAVSSLLWLSTLNATLFNKEVVKGWLHDSGVYGQLVPSLVKAVPQQQQLPSNELITADTTRQALLAAFTPQYIEEQAGRALDSTYGWLEGKTASPSFTIPIDNKKTTVTDNLVLAIKPQIAALPACSTQTPPSSEGIVCRPPAIPADEFAKMVAAEAVNQNQMLSKPLTEASLAAVQPPNTDTQILSQLPASIQWLRWLLVALPITIVVCLGAIALAATDRLTAFSRLARRIFFGATLTLIVAATLWYVSGNPNIVPGFASLEAGSLVAIFAPVLQKLIGGIAAILTLWSGTVTGVSAGIWIALSALRRRRQPQPVSPPQSNPTDDPQLPPSPTL